MPSSVNPTRTVLLASGTISVIASLIFGIGGWIVVDGMMRGSAASIRSASGVIDDAARATDAAAASVTNMRQVVEEIESAARSGGRTLGAVEELLLDISNRAAEDVAQGLESTVDAMPGIIRTGQVIDRTLSALSLIGVDYDPAVPLDTALESLRDSLSPLPDEIRGQASILEEAAADLARIAESSGNLAASLLEIRIDLLEAESIVSDAALDVEEVSSRFEELASDFDGYRTWMPWLVAAAAMALASVGVAILALGRQMGERGTLSEPDEAKSA